MERDSEQEKHVSIMHTNLNKRKHSTLIIYAVFIEDEKCFNTALAEFPISIETRFVYVLGRWVILLCKFWVTCAEDGQENSSWYDDVLHCCLAS